MKKNIILLALLFCGTFCFAKSVYVSVKTADIIAKPSLFGKKVSKVVYGAELSVISENNKYYQVSSSSGSGWIAKTKTSTRKLFGGSSANATEIALAGRGLSKELENLYKNADKGDFKAVDEVETISVNLETLEDFIKQGNLILEGEED